MLDFNRHHRNRRPIGMGMNTPRRLLTLAGLGALMLLLVWRGQQWGRLRFGDTSSGNGDTALQARLGANDAAGDEKVGPSDRQALFPGVNRAYLDTVRDDTVFRAAEGNAWFHLLALLAKTDGSALKTASLGQVGYLQLDEQPDSYRGRLVTVEGVIRAAKQVAAPENEYDVKQYYQLWLQPDRGAENLIVVYALELPRNFPLGEALDQPAGATGFFFKRWAYNSRGGIATAPLVLAKTIDWEPAPAPVAAEPVDEQIFFAVAVALLLALAFVGWLVVRGRSPRRTIGLGPATITIPESSDPPEISGRPESTHQPVEPSDTSSAH